MIVGFHDINENPKSPWAITPEDFSKYILNLIQTATAYDDLEIHFDDGRIGVYKYALPLLQKHTKILKPVVFVVPSWVNGFAPPNERYSEFMNWEELRLLHRAGFEIGSHSLTHPNLTMLDKKQISHELSRSRDLIQIKLGCIVSKFAYPYGVYNEQVINMTMRHYSNGYGINQPEKVTRWNIPRKLIVST